MKKSLLILCTGNSCRSQMMEAYIRFFAKDKIDVKSAGIEVHGVNKNAIKIMAEDGIDIGKYTSNNVDEYMEIKFDYIITVCDNALESCPVFPSNAIKIHHNFSDPAKAIGSNEEIIVEFRKVRNQIKVWANEFVLNVLS